MPKNTDDTKYFADKYFNFLITEFGFKQVPEYYVSYEYHFGYRKDKIEINFACEADGTTLPWVTLRNFNKTTKIGDKEFPEYYYLTEIELTENIKKIFQRRSDRYFPSNSKFDYEEKGRVELELLLKENADIIRRHPEILSGNLKAFPKKKNNKNIVVKTSISILQPDGKYKTIVTEQKSKTTISNWFKKLFG